MSLADLPLIAVLPVQHAHNAPPWIEFSSHPSVAVRAWEFQPPDATRHRCAEGHTTEILNVGPLQGIAPSLGVPTFRQR